MEATPGLLLLQVPPGAGSLTVPVFPIQAPVLPVIAGVWFTVIGAVVLQPVGKV